MLELVRGLVNEQYPKLMSTLYPGELATAQKPFRSIDDMWLAFNICRLVKTPTMNERRIKTFVYSTPRGSFFAFACQRPHTRPFGHAVLPQQCFRIVCQQPRCVESRSFH